eukprot:6670292-Prymnesium_polylepis.1
MATVRPRPTCPTSTPSVPPPPALSREEEEEVIAILLLLLLECKGERRRQKRPFPCSFFEIALAMTLTRCATFLVAALCGGAAAFTPSPRVLLPAAGVRVASSAAPLGTSPQSYTTAAIALRHRSPSMGLFGLGWGEIGVLAVVGLLVFGPEKLAPMAKDIGEHEGRSSSKLHASKSASGLKEVADSFSEGLAEGNVNADELKAANPSVLETTAVKEEEKEKQ